MSAFPAGGVHPPHGDADRRPNAGTPLGDELVLLMAALVLDDLKALDDCEQPSASGRVTKFSREPLEDDLGTLHPVGGAP